MAQIGSMDDDADAMGSLHAQINAAMADASAANTRADGLMAQIGNMDDDADAMGSLHAQINAAMADGQRGQHAG